MAKQTYTTGQVVTAAQMTTLQTNDFNQTVSAKTASYTLAAADAGTRITMSNASATTVTVNTAIFEAGDTLEITNIGAGICTVTAGTATVSTSSTLALKQFDTGQLYFTSTGVAIFFMADAADASASGLSHINTTTFSAVSSQAFNNVFSATYQNYKIIATIGSSDNNTEMRFRYRASATDITVDYRSAGLKQVPANTNGGYGGSTTYITLGFGPELGFPNAYDITVYRPNDAGVRRPLTFTGWQAYIAGALWGAGDQITSSVAFDGFSIIGSGGTLTGTVRVYGLANS